MNSISPNLNLMIKAVKEGLGATDKELKADACSEMFDLKLGGAAGWREVRKFINDY